MEQMNKEKMRGNIVIRGLDAEWNKGERTVKNLLKGIYAKKIVSEERGVGESLKRNLGYYTRHVSYGWWS